MLGRDDEERIEERALGQLTQTLANNLCHLSPQPYNPGPAVAYYWHTTQTYRRRYVLPALARANVLGCAASGWNGKGTQQLRVLAHMWLLDHVEWSIMLNHA